MTDDPLIPRKWMLRAHDQHNVFVWNRHERSVHTVMKALMWALYLPHYPQMSIEIRIGDRYKPDVVALPQTSEAFSNADPLFWAEAGQVSRSKIGSLARRYRSTHFAIGKWDTMLTPYVELVQDTLRGLKRDAPFDLLAFPPDSVDRFIDDDGRISITLDDVRWVRL